MSICKMPLLWKPTARRYQSRCFRNWQHQPDYLAMHNRKMVLQTDNTMSNIPVQFISTPYQCQCEYFETLNKADNTAIKQYIEWHKVII
jgi:hypothetical protein